MKLRILLYLSIGVAVTGCGQDFGMSSLESGEEVVFENRQEVRREVLSPDQLHSLSQWFDRHQSNWHGLLTPGSSEPVLLELSLKHTDGKSTLVSVVTQRDGHHYLRLTSSEKWAYRSAGGSFKSWAAVRPISDEELDTLQRLLRTGG
jgi:hypothetical protein